MNTVAILLSSFTLSIVGLFFFIWSLRKRLFDPDPAAAKVIFSEGEIGQVDEPAASALQRSGLQKTARLDGIEPLSVEQQARLKKELAERIEADKSTSL